MFLVLFTDLDGTLLDEHTYTSQQSVAALRRLQKWRIPIIFCSSKTRAEQEAIRAALNVNDPFIVENGSAIVIPPQTIETLATDVEDPNGTRIIILGERLALLRSALAKIRESTHLNFHMFHELTVREIADITGLDATAAAQALQREYSEPVIAQFSGTELRTFMNACSMHNLQAAQGGKFLGVTGKGADKGRAVNRLVEAYCQRLPRVVTVGIGDSPNDFPMLRAVDHPYLVQRPNGRWSELQIPNLTHVQAVGPLGFTAMVDQLEQRFIKWLATS